MVGILDSGMGGIAALGFLRGLSPTCDAVILADRENAPYGTKSKSELIPIIIRGIEKIRSYGADTVLIACCTASAVFDGIPEKYKHGVFPIIRHVAEEACRISTGGKIGVISTEATRRSGRFVSDIRSLRDDAEVFSVSSGKLVSMAESGAADGNLTAFEKEAVRCEIAPLIGLGIDTVILGCTHFSFFEKTIENMLGVRAVNSARIGAEMLNKKITPDLFGEGRTVYI